ncbi:hypothetical protein CVT24_007955 [Panaeolus cyanescens]|uniref:Uncharacterized protein n=1 Tax=Panaeolus cyanescens TaxID=181874 RepID=A0A409X314_9AGAR|nr:hypothetical protein CVT24_007955 [Panaeolus cyanescens]
MSDSRAVSMQELRLSLINSKAASPDPIPATPALPANPDSAGPATDNFEDGDVFGPTDFSSPSSQSTASAIGQFNPSCKRPLEDLTQYAATVAHTRKLQRKDEVELERFAKLDTDHKLIWIAGTLLKVHEGQEKLTIPEAAYTLLKSLEAQIDHLSFTLLMDPHAAAYINTKIGPLSVLMEKLEQSAEGWITKAIKNDKSKMDTILSKARSRLMHRRSDIKRILFASLAVAISDAEDDTTAGNNAPVADARNIYVLCEDLLNICKRSGPGIQVTVQLCARVAFLREIATRESATTSNGISKFWENVDKELASTRTDLTDATMQSMFFGKILDNDLKIYGKFDLNSLKAS